MKTNAVDSQSWQIGGLEESDKLLDSITFSWGGVTRMKLRCMNAICMAVTLLISSSRVAQGEDTDWIEPHVQVSTTETIARDMDGNISMVTLVRQSRIAVSRTVTEVRQRSRTGTMELTGRTTETNDGIGGIVRVEEAPGKDAGTLIVLRINTTTTTPTGSVVTTEVRDESGRMSIVSRTTTTRNPDGGMTVTTEVPDRNGELTATTTTRTFQNVGAQLKLR